MAIRICRTCKNEYLLVNNFMGFCSSECRDAFDEREVIPKLEKKGGKRRSLLRSILSTNPKGCYVYAWLDKDEIFYIGKGYGNRAVEKHNQEAENRRITADGNFSVVIIQDSLTNREAYLIESCLLRILHPSCNLQTIKNCRLLPLSGGAKTAV